MQFTTVNFRGLDYRFPVSTLGGTSETPRLKPASELLLDWAYDGKDKASSTTILHDRDGVLFTCLSAEAKCFCSDNVVHLKRARAAFTENYGEDLPREQVLRLAQDELPAHSLYLLHLPKSLDLFEVYLEKVTRSAGPGARLAAAFQTRHFTPRMLEIAGRYAGKVEQSRAFKKARLLILSDLHRPDSPPELCHQTEYADKTYQNHFGVFSARRIDLATRFLLESWAEESLLRDLPAPERLLDVGCGWGVLGDQLQRQFYPTTKLAGTDVSDLAIRSTRRNTSPENDLRWADDLSGWDDSTFSLIVTNPPFHDGHRNTIAISLDLFREALAKLTAGGHLVVVANRHLNYRTHLSDLFTETLVVAENKKFVIYRCRKG